MQQRRFDYEVQKPTHGILIAILVEGDLTIVREILSNPFEEIAESYARAIVKELRTQLDKTIRSNGVEKSIRWSGIKVEYEIIAINDTVQE